MGRSAKKQAKHARKVLGFYRQAFGLERPYQLILHGGFIQHCLQQKVFFREQLIEIHDAPVTLHVTRDTRQELRKLGPSHDGAAVVCKRLINLAYEPPTDSEEDEEDGAEQLAAPESVGELELQDRSDKSESDEDEDDSDGDDDEAEGDGAGTGTGRSELSAGQRRRRALAAHKARERARLDEEAEAARHPDPAFAATNHALRALMREQPGQYIVAVQDGPLRAQLRRIPGVPLVYADRGSGQICFEQPSKASERWAAKVEQSKQVASEAERKLYGGQLVDILDQAAQGQLKK
jgi:rRNA-processing protein FCF1